MANDHPPRSGDSIPSSPYAPGAVTSLGEVLRQARERQGLTLEQISQTTKIPVRHLEALEQNNLAGVPSGMYQRAEIRAYADAVGLDRHLALQSLARAVNAPPPEPAAPAPAPPAPLSVAPPRRPLAIPRIALACLCVVVFVSAWMWASRSGRPSSAEGGTTAAAEPAVVAASSATATTATPPAGETRTASPAIVAAATSSSGGAAAAAGAVRPATGIAATGTPARGGTAAAAPRATNTAARGAADTAARGATGVAPQGASDARPPAAASAASASAPAAPRPAEYPVLQVVTEPAGARVTVDGVGWGQTPVTIRFLPIGVRRVRATLDGYVAQERSVTIAQEVPRTTVRLTLQPAP